MGLTGLVMTDDIGMKALSGYFRGPDAVRY